MSELAQIEQPVVTVDEAAAVAEIFAKAGWSIEHGGKIDDLVSVIQNSGGALDDSPVNHTFTPGLYRRTIFMKKGRLIISKIHKTEHPFAVLEGVASVWTECDGLRILSAGCYGVTKPGTRRVLFIHEDSVWSTFHPTTETDVEKIEDQIISKGDIEIQQEAIV